MEKLILMSIKTKYANQIFSGIKKYEYRKKSIGVENCNKKIFIYSSGFDKKIIGYIIIDKIISGDINYVLKVTDNVGNNDVIKYFGDSNSCYAFHIFKTYKFSKPISLNEIKNMDNNFTIPQFYRYIRNDNPIYEMLINNK